jgi:hypothetical protein
MCSASRNGAACSRSGPTYLHVRKPRRSASRRPCPVSSNRPWRGRLKRCHRDRAGSTKSSSTATASRYGAYPTGRSNDWVKKTCAQRETLTIAGFALDGSKWDGLYVGRRKGGRIGLRRQGGPLLRQGLGRGSAEAPDASCSQNVGLCQAGRAQGHLGRTQAAGQDRIPCEVDRWKGATSALQGIAGGPVTPASSALGRPL